MSEYLAVYDAKFVRNPNGTFDVFNREDNTWYMDAWIIDTIDESLDFFEINDEKVGIAIDPEKRFVK